MDTKQLSFYRGFFFGAIFGIIFGIMFAAIQEITFPVTLNVAQKTEFVAKYKLQPLYDSTKFYPPVPLGRLGGELYDSYHFL